MALKELLRKMSSLKEKILEDHSYDKTNISDNIRARSPLAKNLYSKSVDMYRKILRTQEDVQLETDINVQAKLVSGGLTFLAKEKGAAGNLVTVIIKNGAVDTVVDKFTITITANTSTATNADIAAQINAKAQAVALIGVSVEAGTELTVVSTVNKSLTGGK